MKDQTFKIICGQHDLKLVIPKEHTLFLPRKDHYAKKLASMGGNFPRSRIHFHKKNVDVANLADKNLHTFPVFPPVGIFCVVTGIPHSFFHRFLSCGSRQSSDETHPKKKIILLTFTDSKKPKFETYIIEQSTQVNYLKSR